MSGERAGLELALMAQLAEADAEDLQLGLFAEPQTAGGQAKALMRGPRGPGRPPGARNKRTERTVAFLLARHRDPREVLLEIAEANVADLAALYGCTMMEAGQEKRLAAAAVLPYVAQRQPLAIDLNTRSVVYLSLDGAAADRGEDSAGIGVVTAVVVGQQDQRLGVATSARED